MTTTQKVDYRAWTQYRWTSPDVDWKKAKLITGGIDVGSVSTQAVILADGELYCYSNMRTGSNSPDSGRNALNWALEGTGLTQDKINFIVGTGYGRVNIPMANRAVTEIACHARGANVMYGPTVRTVLDMGGQDCKAIHVDDKGKVMAFLMNDKCAAGTGRGMEVIADLFAIPITEVGPASLDVDEEPDPVSSTCVVFAKSEAAGLLRQGWSRNKVLAAYCAAMADRVNNLLQRIGMEREFGITGGIAKNIGIVKRLEQRIGFEALKPKLDPQIAGALGAALFAKGLAEKAGK